MRAIVKLSDGAIYEGEWDKERNVVDGRGVKIWTDGTRYDGKFVNGQQHGYGRLVNVTGETFEGQWKNN